MNPDSCIPPVHLMSPFKQYFDESDEQLYPEITFFLKYGDLVIITRESKFFVAMPILQFVAKTVSISHPLAASDWSSAQRQEIADELTSKHQFFNAYGMKNNMRLEIVDMVHAYLQSDQGLAWSADEGIVMPHDDCFPSYCIKAANAFEFDFHTLKDWIPLFKFEYCRLAVIYLPSSA